MDSLTRTERNLWSAFLGEAKANRMYTAYAMQAMEEGLPEIAQIFLEAAGAETIHATSHLRALGEVRSTEENLLNVIRGEAYESATMYPRMIREAEEEGQTEATRSFRLAWEREGHHFDLFESALKTLGVSPDKWADIPAPAPTPPDPANPNLGGEAAAHEVESEKERIARLSRIREVVFGAQDGLISTVALVSSVFGAVTDNFLIVLAGLAGALGGMISMAAGSFLSSKAQRELYEAEIAREAQEMEDHPGEEMAELIEIYRKEGLSYSDAISVAERVGSNKQVMLNTMIEKELGLSPELPGSPLLDGLTMGVSFVIAAFIPILPYFFMEGIGALIVSVSAAAVALFGMGAGKSILTKRPWLMAGLEVLLIGTAAGLLGYLLGTIVPGLFGVSAGS